MDSVIDEFERHTAVILAAEDWAKGYKRSPEQYGKMLLTGARFERKTLQLFADVAKQTDTFINWSAYIQRRAVQADDFTVDIVLEDQIDQLTEVPFMQIALDPVLAATILGADSGEVLYKIDTGLSLSSELIQSAAKNQIAGLIGKRVDKDGVIVPAARSEYHITTKMKNEIRQAIGTSISLNEDIDTARSRVQKVIVSPKRAQTIALTETVNAYNNGIMAYGHESGAVGKEWQDTGAQDICAVFARQGIVTLDHEYQLPDGRKIKAPSAHPHCRCFERLVYQEELTG